MSTTYSLYDENGDFVHFVLDRDEAYDYASRHEPVPNSWEVKPHTKDSGFLRGS